MEYKIVKKEAFPLTVISKEFTYEEAPAELPRFWTEYHQSGKGEAVCGVYGVSIDENMEGSAFEYLIGDRYDPARETPEGFQTRVIPAHTWAVFACKGACPHAVQDVHKKIFSQWLPNCKEYEIAAGYNIELYTDPAEYAKGLRDEAYYSEIWIPVQKK